MGHSTALPERTLSLSLKRCDATLLLAGVSSILAFALPVPRGGRIADLPSPCLFYNITGIPCPGCGMTRSVVCCAHGLWHQALLYHPLGPLVLGGMIGLCGWRLARLHPRTRFDLSPRFGMIVGMAAIMLLLATWAVRLAGYWPLPSG